MTHAMLETRSLIVDVPGRPAPTPLDLSVQAGQVWGLLGPNGTGKTTLLHTLAGLRPPRAGSVLLRQRALAHWSRRDLARQRAVVFQERQDTFPATVMEAVMMGRHPWLSPWQQAGDGDRERVTRALDALSLGSLASRSLHHLSGGERQRVAVAAAWAQAPQLWLVDEPTNHLDLRHQVQVMDLLMQQARSGCAVVLCLHDLNLAARYCDHLLLMFPDRPWQTGTTEALLEPGLLSALYGQPLTRAWIEGVPVFVPSGAGDAENRSPGS